MHGRRRIAERSTRGRQLATRSGARLAMAIEPPTTVADGASGGGGSGAGGGEDGPPQVVFVKRGMIAKCLTCPLCHKLFRDATTICECLHTFCRKCIYEKLNEEELDCCPVCNIHLGVVPVDKLRPDHSLQDVRAKLFPFKRRKVEAPEAPPITLPPRRKERSLSSLVVDTPQVSSSSLTGRRTKVVARRGVGSHASSLATNDTNAKDDGKIDKLAEHSSSAENLSKLAPNKRQNFSNAEPSISTPSKDADNFEESFQKSELWKPLNCLVEAANRTKSFKSTPQSPNTKTDQTIDPDNEGISRRTRVKDHPNKSKLQDDSNEPAESSSVTGKSKRLQGRKRREAPNSAQAVLDAPSSQCDRRISPIWFSLVASFDQSGDPPLPQIPSNYLRIKDGSVPVSFIQKYLVAKLNLASESEVEVTCHGQPVSPSMPLQNLVEQWLREGPSHKLQATVGTSAKEFVMVLAYGRRRKVSVQ